MLSYLLGLLLELLLYENLGEFPYTKSTFSLNYNKKHGLDILSLFQER